jgi:regulatory protein
VSGRIESIVPVDGKSTVEVQADGTTYEIARGAAEAMGLAPGMPVSAALRARIEAAADRRAAAARVLRYLRQRPRTAQEVRLFLRRHGHPEDTVQTVVAELEAQRVVDDARYAALFVESRRSGRPVGAARIARELRQRGVGRELVESVVGARGAAGVESELERALAAARPRLAAAARLGRERGMRRLVAFLQRRGFSAGVARAACLRLFAGRSVDSGET